MLNRSRARKTRMPPQGNLRKLRDERGLSVENMAKVAGISRSAYLKKENGETDFRITEAKKIMDYFEKPIDAIFFT